MICYDLDNITVSTASTDVIIEQEETNALLKEIKIQGQCLNSILEELQKQTNLLRKIYNPE